MGASVVDKRGAGAAFVLFKTAAMASHALREAEEKHLMSLAVDPGNPAPKVAMLEGEALDDYWSSVQKRGATTAGPSSK